MAGERDGTMEGNGKREKHGADMGRVIKPQREDGCNEEKGVKLYKGEGCNCSRRTRESD